MKTPKSVEDIYKKIREVESELCELHRLIPVKFGNSYCTCKKCNQKSQVKSYTMYEIERYSYAGEYYWFEYCLICPKCGSHKKIDRNLSLINSVKEVVTIDSDKYKELLLKSLK